MDPTLRRDSRSTTSSIARSIGILAIGDVVLQLLIVAIGLVLFFNPNVWLDPIHLGSAPKWSDLIFALTIAVIAFTSLESASGLSGEVRISRAGLKRLVGGRGGVRVVGLAGLPRARCVKVNPRWKTPDVSIAACRSRNSTSGHSTTKTSPTSLWSSERCSGGRP